MVFFPIYLWLSNPPHVRVYVHYSSCPPFAILYNPAKIFLRRFTFCCADFRLSACSKNYDGILTWTEWQRITLCVVTPYILNIYDFRYELRILMGLQDARNIGPFRLRRGPPGEHQRWVLVYEYLRSTHRHRPAKPIQKLKQRAV